MNTVAGIFEGFGGPTELGRALGVAASTASEMKRRRSIPIRYWEKLIAAAAARNLPIVTYETLAKMHATRSKRSAA